VPAPKILVVEDEASIANLVVSYLRKEGYEVFTASDGPGGLKAARSFKPDLIVLDIMLPGMDGLEVLAHIRREANPYVILLTARSEEVDKLVGLSMGADDYLTKPFSPRELAARVKAALRRLQTGIPAAGTPLVFQRLRIDVAARLVWLDDQPVELTAMEFDLLRVLAEHHGIALSREQLLEQVWGTNYYGETRVVDVHIGHLRQKFGDETLITTIRGVGYRFDDERL
jgi:two-component system, OmpR family, alkaline phosphatase synthesis response regulator PhoP